MKPAQVLESGWATGVGSLPYEDAGAAALVELQLHPEFPSSPQLPRRSVHEGMLAQVAASIDGVSPAPGGRLRLDRRRVEAPAADRPLDREAWAGTLAFLTAATGRTGPLKLQVAGPVTLGLALIDAGAKPARAFAAARGAVEHAISGLVAEARTSAPEASVMVVLDEPSLTRAMHPGFPLVPEETVDLLSTCLATATRAGAALNGVHCCGPVDWSLVLHAGPDVISLPVTSEIVHDAVPLGLFLERGGWVAWGVVPTDRPISERHEPHWQRLNDVWKQLTAAGCDPVRLRTQSLLTPACGLAYHDEAQVPVVMSIVRRVAERVQDQAYAARLSVGA